MGERTHNPIVITQCGNCRDGDLQCGTRGKAPTSLEQGWQRQEWFLREMSPELGLKEDRKWVR